MKQHITKIFTDGLYEIININKACYVKNIYASVSFMTNSTRNVVDIDLNYNKPQSETSRVSLNMGLVKDLELQSDSVVDIIKQMETGSEGFYLQSQDSLTINVPEKNETERGFRTDENAYISIVVNYEDVK